MRLNRKLLAPLAAAAAVALALVGAPASTAAVHNPILFVHGWGGNGTVWNNMIGKFKADGWSSGSLYTISYNSYASNKTTANAIKTKVDQIRAAHGGAKVDVITHSMGGLNSRWYLKFLGGTSAVDEWVSLGGPNHGTDKARDCLGYSYASCSEMLPGSSFLQQLNANDETSGYVRYGTWRSPCDAFIIPNDSTILSGATNTQTGCIGHLYLRTNDTVYYQVRNFVW